MQRSIGTRFDYTVIQYNSIAVLKKMTNRYTMGRLINYKDIRGHYKDYSMIFCIVTRLNESETVGASGQFSLQSM